MITVAIVDDDASFAEGVKLLLDRSGRFKCVATCPSAEDALIRLPLLKPDVVLMDIELPQASGVQAVGPLKARLPGTEIMMLTIFKDNESIYRALAAGATGYLSKPSNTNELLDSIHSLLKGGSPMSAGIARKVVTAFRALGPAPQDADDLSQREQEVLDGLAKGRRYKEVAQELKLSFHTVRTHVQHIYKKLHVRSRAEAIKKRRLL